MWTKAKDFFRYGKRIERRKVSNKSTKKDGASVLFDKMTNTDTPRTNTKEESEYTNNNEQKETIGNNSYVNNHNVKSNNEETRKDVSKKTNYSGKNQGSARYRIPSSKGEYNTAEEKKQAAIRDNYKGPTCPYCGAPTKIKTAKEHTGNDNNYCYWTCSSCSDVSVTTIKGGYLPSGIPANAKTRRLRVSAHKYLYSKKQELKFNNNALNKWISSSLSIDVNRAWIGQLSESELVNIIIFRQKEIYEDKYADIFNRIK